MSVVFIVAYLNTGSIGGLLVLFNEARHASYRAEQPAEPFFAMEFKVCDDHILALVLTWFNVLFCAWAEGKGRLDLIHNKKFKVNAQERESKLALPLHALRRVQKRVFTFNKSAWRAARAIHDEAHLVPRGKLKPRIIRCSLGRFCTFGKTAGGVVWYRNAITT